MNLTEFSDNQKTVKYKDDFWNQVKTIKGLLSMTWWNTTVVQCEQADLKFQKHQILLSVAIMFSSSFNVFWLSLYLKF